MIVTHDTELLYSCVDTLWHIHDNKIVVYDNFHRDTLSSSGLSNHPNLTIIKWDLLDYPLLEKSLKSVRGLYFNNNVTSGKLFQ